MEPRPPEVDYLEAGAVQVLMGEVSHPSSMPPWNLLLDPGRRPAWAQRCDHLAQLDNAYEESVSVAIPPNQDHDPQLFRCICATVRASWLDTHAPLKTNTRIPFISSRSAARSAIGPSAAV